MANKRRRSGNSSLIAVFLILMVVLVVAIVLIVTSLSRPNSPINMDGSPAPSDVIDNTPESSPTPQPTPTPVPLPDPSNVADTDPDKFGLRYDLELDGVSITDYTSSYRSYFGDPRNFSAIEGVTTFRGNNFRDDATYGSAGKVENKKLQLMWTTEIPGSIAKSGGSGSWFGMGLGKGNPKSIPFVEQDFIFTCICEELGVCVGICLILMTLMVFLIACKMAYRMKDKYFQLLAFGIGCMYIFQVFLTVGGGITLIPLTGVTLPFVSYGGSSSTVTMFMIFVLQAIEMRCAAERRTVHEGNEKER